MQDVRLHFQDMRYDWDRDLDVQWQPERGAASTPPRDAVDIQPQEAESWHRQVATTSAHRDEGPTETDQEEPVRRGPIKPPTRQTLRSNSERVTESHPGLKNVPRPFEIWLLELYQQARSTKKFRGRFDLIDGQGSSTYEEPLEDDAESEEETPTRDRRPRKKRGSPGLGGAFLAVYARGARQPTT